MQAAYDVNNPNGTGRRPQGARVTFIFRLYRTLRPTTLDTANESGGILGAARSASASARTFIQDQILARLQSRPGERRVLVREVQCPLIIDAQEEIPEMRSSFTYVADGPAGQNFYIDQPFL